MKSDLNRSGEILSTTQDYAASILEAVSDRPVSAEPHPPEPVRLQEVGHGFEVALADFQTRWAPGFSGSAGPRYLGFVTGGATLASIAGDWLTSVFDQNPTSALDSTAPYLERETIGWLREMFGISDAHTGCFVTGATMSNMVGLAIGREWLGEQMGVSVSEDGIAALGAVNVLSGAAHSSVYKALSILGFGRQAMKRIALLPAREAVDVFALEEQLRALKGAPAIVVANAGTVNTVDFDDLPATVELRTRYKFWLHVDAAFGGFAALTEEHAGLVNLLDQADSICIDCHKWLNVPYDSAIQFTRRRDLQVRVFQNYATYLGVPQGVPDFVHLTPENSRRLRALACWFSLAAYGKEGQRDIVQRNVDAARRLGEHIKSDARLSLLDPVRMNVVCFTLANEPSEERVQALVRELRDRGEVFLTPTTLHGTWALRAAFSNWRTELGEADRIFAAIIAAL
ncbi:pyridoxal-dependent decarboxylase [Paraburkholderia sp. BL6669N2]|uniref:pyridoxal phosphate-dependent decarboxylase family protein n=1 Tax=Paraburkholderia sp. BL6669N2 TaxID=1938807 RepID=UPI00216198C1|nr:pyridoxal-dependent decarboxylase [Paraburkholderia sp. BL6669N2]